uniref:Uncharacterized protein n=1 Tax=Physcomitrium patens TaxID=3218 RepID=A9TK44_PHYPA|nr:hypothetical protein PHYPA_019837 [Physcomitrium patens]
MASFERSSLAPLLLVVAVLAGTCAPIVSALWANGLMVGNGCHKPIEVVVAFKHHRPDETLHVDAGKKEELKSTVLIKHVDYIEFTIYKKEYYIKHDDYFHLSSHTAVFSKISVLCDAPKPCGHAFITVKITIWDLKKEITETICIKK